MYKRAIGGNAHEDKCAGCLAYWKGARLPEDWHWLAFPQCSLEASLQKQGTTMEKTDFFPCKVHSLEGEREIHHCGAMANPGAQEHRGRRKRKLLGGGDSWSLRLLGFSLSPSPLEVFHPNPHTQRDLSAYLFSFLLHFFSFSTRV
jgi:hypothetical protein